MGIFDEGMKNLTNQFNPSGTGTVFEQNTDQSDFLTWATDKYGLTEEGKFDLISEYGTPEGAPKFIKSFLQYQGETPTQNKIEQMMNNTGFMMGLSLLKQASEGKGVGAALQPAAEATQAFMTNQELRSQNKRLMRTKEGELIVSLMAATQAHEKGEIEIQAGEINLALLADKAEMSAIDVSKYANVTEINIKALLNDLAIDDLNIDKAKHFLKYADQNALLDLATKRLNNVNTSASNKLLYENIANSAFNLKVKEYNQKSIEEKDKIFEATIKGFLKDETITEEQADNFRLRGREAYTGIALQANIDETAAIDIYMDGVGKSWMQSLPFFGLSRTETLRARTTIYNQIVKVARTLSPDGETFLPENIQAATKILEAEGYLESNNWAEDFFLFKTPYDFGPRVTERAMGGAVEGGKPYLVGEDGPEVIVPHHSGSVVSNAGTPGGYTWEEAIIDSSEMLAKIKQSSGIGEAKKALKKFRPDLYI